MSDIKVRVGQQNAVKVISSLSGSTANASISESVIGGIGSIRELYVSGISTFIGISTFQLISVSGVTNSNSYHIDSIQVISSDRELQNIISLDNTTKNTIESAIANAPNDFTSLYVSGISTLAGITQVTGETLFSNQLNISGLSTFFGASYFNNDVYINGNLTISQDLNFDEFSARNGSITGILTVSEYIDYGTYGSYGIAYFNPEGILTSTQSTDNNVDDTNYILTTDNAGIPIWSNAIDGGFY